MIYTKFKYYQNPMTKGEIEHARSFTIPENIKSIKEEYADKVVPKSIYDLGKTEDLVKEREALIQKEYEKINELDVKFSSIPDWIRTFAIDGDRWTIRYFFKGADLYYIRISRNGILVYEGIVYEDDLHITIVEFLSNYIGDIDSLNKKYTVADIVKFMADGKRISECIRG
jgi:hypothetical protein